MRFEPQIDALNLTPRLNPRGDDTNVCTMSSITLYRDTFQLAPIDMNELNMFKAQFTTLLTMPGSDERKIMLDRVEQYVTALRAIKQALNSIKFSGVNAEDTELGMAFIRPQFTRANAVASLAVYRANWNQALVAAPWADWIFDGAGQPMSVGRDFGLVITHLKSLVTPTPFMTECRFQVGRTQLLPLDTRNALLADTENNIAIVAIPTMIIIPKGTFYARARSDVPGTDVVPLGGLVFGLGRALKEEIPTWLP